MIYFLYLTLVDFAGGADYFGGDSVYPNLLIGDIGCIIIPGIYLIIKYSKEKKVLSKDPKIIGDKIERLIYHYLKNNEGKAYTIKSLKNTLMNKMDTPFEKEYLRKNIEKILNKMNLKKKIQSIQKNGDIYYNINQ